MGKGKNGMLVGGVLQAAFLSLALTFHFSRIMGGFLLFVLGGRMDSNGWETKKKDREGRKDS